MPACPRCGSELQYDGASGSVFCAKCGFTAPLDPRAQQPRRGEPDALTTLLAATALLLVVSITYRLDTLYFVALEIAAVLFLTLFAGRKGRR
jgi:DNA-directed RNA polymerase subunit RPC12/RpoP